MAGLHSYYKKTVIEKIQAFFPRSLIEAPTWYARSSIIRNLSCDILKIQTGMGGYCALCLAISSLSWLSALWV